MSSTHEERLRAAFTAQSVTMEDARLNSAFTAGLEWLVGLAAPVSHDVAIDVAGGTGLVARALAPRVDSVVVADLTPAMLDAARAAAAAEGLTNVDYLLADATALPVPDASYSLVVTRFSLHHVPDPTAVLDELVRIARPGGRIVVMDLVSSADPTLTGKQDEIEILRDDSHLRMLTPGEAAAELAARGCTVRMVEQRRFERPLQPWLDQSATPADRAAQVRARLADELGGGPVTGMQPSRRDDDIWFTHTWETTVVIR